MTRTELRQLLTNAVANMEYLYNAMESRASDSEAAGRGTLATAQFAEGEAFRARRDACASARECVGALHCWLREAMPDLASMNIRRLPEAVSYWQQGCPAAQWREYYARTQAAAAQAEVSA
jgi:hypothetical protein